MCRKEHAAAFSNGVRLCKLIRGKERGAVWHFDNV